MNKTLTGLLLSAAISSGIARGQELKESEQWWGHRELLKEGVPMRIVADMNGDLAMRVASSFQENHVPHDWINEMSLESWKHTVAQVQSDQDYVLSAEKLVKYIKEKVQEKEHSARTNADYKEDSFDLAKIEDKILLVLIKKYCDFFDKPENWRTLGDMFPEGKYSDECVGIIRHEKNDVILRRIDTRWEDGFYPPRFGQSSRDSVPSPSVVPYVSHVGILHTHIIKHREDPSEISGPSDNDLNLLRKQNRINPYQVSAVVTFLEEGKFDVDIYLRNIVIKNDIPVNEEDALVYDLGVFKFDK